MVYVADDARLCSSAYCCVAAAYCRRLLMQAFICDVVRALTKFGIAIAANRPMMATTIMISTSVNPAMREVLMFILPYLSVLICGVNAATGGFQIVLFSFTYCLLPPLDSKHLICQGTLLIMLFINYAGH